MQQNWKNIITDINEKKIFEALSESKWDFRTIDGLAKSTKLSTPEVISIIEKNGNLIRKSSIPDANGRDLYTLKEKNIKKKEILNKLRTFISKSID